MLLKTSLALAIGLQIPSLDGGGSGGTDPVDTEGGPAIEGEAYVGTSGELAVAAPRLPSVEIRIDGRLDDPDWSRGALLSGFTQYDPVEGIPGSQKTEVRVIVADDAVFFGVRASDDEEGGIRATLTPRDEFGGSDDFVRFVLDTFNDQRRAFVFQVNPLGVQGDGLWIEGRVGRGEPIDWNPDFLWESAGKVDSDGYSIEVKVPLKSLRFPEIPSQDWGLQVSRRIQRSGQSQSWAPLTDEVANRLSQSGSLRGLSGLRSGRTLEINPVLTGTRLGVRDATAGSFDHGSATGDFGLNASYGLTSNLTLDATYNPDFSQVEADAGQIAVNERFALFFPEKRPFFLEGTDVFTMPRRLVYTRSIGNPVGAAKLSGKMGNLSVAYLGAVDDVSSAGKNPVVNLLRVKRDVGESSSVGLVYTDRSVLGESFNRVVGADARLVLAQRYTIDVMASGSADGGAAEATRLGSLLLTRFSRSGRNFSLDASFEDISEDFQAGSGFIRRVGVTQAEAGAGYTWRGGPGALLESWGPSLDVEGTWNRADFWRWGKPAESDIRLSFRAFFRGNVGGFVSLSRSSYSFSPEAYEGLFLAGPISGERVPFAPSSELFSGLHAARVRGWLSRWERARVSLGASWSETPIFTLGVPADVGESLGGDVNVSLFPTGSTSLELGVRHSTIRRKRDGSRYSTATIPRLAARYQFSRSLFVRASGEYSSQTRGGVLDPISGSPVLRCVDECEARSGSDRHDFRLEGLVAYEPSPGTVMYLGYSRQMEDTGAFAFRDVTSKADGLFVKLSYRFRM